MALGPVFGLIGIDIDGTEGVRRLEQIIGIIPETLAFTTPGGQDRRRLLFPHPSMEVANRSLRMDGHEAVRIVTKGAQTVMPPSRHASGGRYHWTNQSAPLPFPQLLLDYLLLPESPSVIAPPPVAPAPPLPGQASAFTRARAYLALCDAAVAGQGGHNQTFKIACKLVKGFGLGAETALQLLLSDYNPRCEPPWTEKELRHKVNDAVRAPGETGTMLSNGPNTLGCARWSPTILRRGLGDCWPR
jgi:Bifunctional DNA primase/polymerase, N-terminal